MAEIKKICTVCFEHENEDNKRLLEVLKKNDFDVQMATPGTYRVYAPGVEDEDARN